MPDRNVVTRRRHLPHWTLADSTDFVTFRLLRGELTPTERRTVRDHITAGHGRYYDLAAAVVMPDHVHLLLAPHAGYELSRVMKGIKGVSAKRLNEARGTSGPVWQDESWDRIVRDAAEFDEKLAYMLNNPVKAGLFEDGMRYGGWWCCPDLGQAEMPVPPGQNRG